MEQIKKFWLGQTPMWFNFWILGVLFFKVIFYGITFGLSALNIDILTVMRVVEFISYPLLLVWAVGTWRSTSFYKGNKIWSMFTQIYVAITIGTLFFTLYLQFTS